MAGEVKYHTSPCPFGEKHKVGSVGCQLCKHHGKCENDIVECNHE